MLRDALTAPFRMLWQIAPPEYSVPMMVLTALLMIYFAAKVAMMWDEQIDVETGTSTGGYTPGEGYKYSLEDFDE